MKHEPRPAIHMEKQLGWAHKLGGGGGEVSGDLQGRSSSVTQVYGVSDMVPACQLCSSVRREFRKGTKGAMAYAHLDARHFSFFLYTTDVFQAAIPVLEHRGTESE